MYNIESERRGLKFGLPAAAGSWWRMHWTLAWAAAWAGRHQRSSQHGAGRQGRKVIVAEGEPGLRQGQQPQLNPDT